MQIENCSFEYDSPIAPKTTFKIGGTAKRVAMPHTEKALGELICELSKSGEKYTVLGNGSNVLFMGDYDGTLVLTKKLCDVCVNGEFVSALCGALVTSVSSRARDEGLSGMEFAYGIPGSIGGGVYMNAGAYGGALSDIVYESKAIDKDGRLVTFSAKDHAFGYRDSAFMHNGLTVVSTTLKLQRGDKEQISALMEDYMQRRKDKQPLDKPSAGSVFKRGDGFITAQVIDRCGLKGLRVGDAQVSEKHAGFIVNLGSATGDDVLRLVEKVKEEVLRMEGKELECEIRIIR
jgi:UDP-N-acetylmuramate dehydrogenase